ncbi:putative ABC transport system permease protein [Lachnospiraceae bacterium NE2001]|nr:putative ABC transport system permease protein [Lachnospiraceae bacterium NE2001]
MLFKLALKNIKKSVKDYSIYFFTLVIGVIIFYIFNALDSQTAMLNVSESTRDILILMNTFLSGVSVFVAIVLGALIIYASNFLIKRRKKEFGVYLTLGMSKRRMSTILLTETFLIGTISLAIGLILGVALSQFMSVAVAHMFEADMSKFAFVFSAKAAVKTIIFFGIMYIVVMIFNTIAVGRCKLIDLLYGEKKNEQLKVRNPILCLVLFTISCVILGRAYYLVTVGFNVDQIFTPKDLVKVIIMGAVSTFFIFWSVSGSILTIVTKMKGFYLKKLNSFTLRQFSSKANTMVLSMTVICLMLFLTIVLLGSAISLTRSMNQNIKKLLPKDLQMVSELYISDKDVMTALKENGFETDRLKDIVSYNSYDAEGLTMGDTMGEYIESALNMYTFVTEDTDETIMALSEYNDFAKDFGNETIELADDEYAIVCSLDPVVKARNDALSAGMKITYRGNELKPAYPECKIGEVQLNINKSNEGVIIVPDSAVEGAKVLKNYIIADYVADTPEAREDMEAYVASFVENNFQKKDTSWDEWYIFYTSKDIMKAGSIGLGAMATFISLYVGIIFLIASAAVLSLKELSESADNIERFEVLRRIGTDEKMIDWALFKQIGMFFFFPMLLAVIHSIFGLKASSKILQIFVSDGMGFAIFITALIIVVIYGGYFLVTYFTSKRIIKG